MKKVLTIAGSDCSGGAGIQADLKTMTALNTYGMSIITALTAQNTMGVQGVLDIEPEFIALQFDSIFTDIVPDSIKIGMVSTIDTIKVISQKLVLYSAKNIVLDPVMVSTSGNKLLQDNAIELLKKSLFPLASVITPNLSEAEVIVGYEINSNEMMIKAAYDIRKLTKAAILIKGGHSKDNCNDMLLTKENEVVWFESERIDNSNTHGTGCTLSSAIASYIALGNDTRASIKKAKNYIIDAISYKLDLGKGSGPLNHCCRFGR